jgi:ubiquinone/menaquinone biosynthesis C-methylase UbiE
MSTESDSEVLAAARAVGETWSETPYYDDAEPYTEHVWRHVSPYLSGCDFSVALDLAAGHGRHSTKLLPRAERLYIVDIRPENVDFCRARFGDDERIRYVVTDGRSLEAIPSDSVTLAFCFDAMVHFDSDTVRAYLREFGRVLRPGGKGFCHHSNYASNPGGDWQDNPHWRNFMSRELFCHYARKSGLRILRSDVIDWTDAPALDCYTLFERPSRIRG